MMTNWRSDPDMTIDAIMRKWPVTMTVLIRRRMLCIGCPIAVYHTVSDICRAHGIDEAAFATELDAAIHPEA